MKKQRFIVSVFCALCLLLAPFTAASVSAAAAAEGAVRYEAEEAEIVRAERKGKDMPADYGTYSGEGFVGSIDYDDSAVIFRVGAENDGEYELFVAYATEVKNSTLKVYNDSGLYATVKCSLVKGWGNFDLTPPAETRISLKKGTNTVKIAKGLNYAELDYIAVGERTGNYKEAGEEDTDIRKPTPGFTRYEAENGAVNGGKIYASSLSSGTGYVGNLDNADSHVAFTVEAAEDGEYEIGLAYAIEPSFSAATLRIFNDCGFYSSVRCERLFGWGIFTKEALVVGTISLKKGQNIVSIYKGNNYAQLDFIEIGAKIGDYKEAGSGAGTAEGPEEGWVRYEAENALVVNAVRKGLGYLTDYGNGNYSGKGFVGNMDDDSRYIDISVTVAEAGLYPVRVRYATGADGAKISTYAGNYGRDGRLQLYGRLECANKTDWGIFEKESTLEFSVGLKAGENFIRIKAAYAEIDFADVGPSTGEYRDGAEISQGNISGEFGEDAFDKEKDEDDGYVAAKKSGCNSSFKSGTVILFTVTAVAGFAVVFRKKRKI